ncbi:hypothetical protein Pcinc_034173 [Petrolisthes cinctipes]|uniref:Uncharacterized protein n=1 Tax=Petrolisthes cinctipes TaxID=88211 RepID=A0AAE1JXV0_PETCI|nr:hypothetical protein Pcinc_034173 [Petrolisthes cinctipes]
MRNVRTAWRPTPALTIRSAVSRAPEAKKEKGERFMTYDPLRCMTCKAFIAESENRVAAAQAELRKHFIAIRRHRHRSHPPSADLMNFLSGKEEANWLLNLAHYIPPSPHSYSGADTITMKDSEPATQADALRQAVASILPHPAPEPPAKEQNSTPRGDGSSPRIRGLAPTAQSPRKIQQPRLLLKKQRQDATLNDISSLLLQFDQRFDKLENDMAVVKGSNSQLQQDRANLKKGKRNLPFSSSSSSSSEDEDDDPPPAAQPVRSLPSSQRSPSPPPYSPATYSLARSSTPSPNYTPTPIHIPSQGTSEEGCIPASASDIQHPVPGSSTPPHHHNPSLRQLLQLLPLLPLRSQTLLLIQLQLPIMHLQELVSSLKINLKF